MSTPNEAAVPPQAAGTPPTLRQLALRGSVLEVIGFGGSQAIRLASNVVLSRLLFPEAFGVSAMVAIFISALEMLSDVGIQPGVVQSPRGDEERFLNTAWTLQVVRGIGLWICACIAAWPMSVLYREPQLALLIPLGSLNVVAAGFSSTSLYTLRRHLRLAELLAIDLGSQVVGTTVMIVWAYMHPSVWALVGSAVVTASVKTLASHTVANAPKNRFAWDPEAYQAILHFGKWVFGATALFFVSKQGDRLLLGRYLGFTVLGVYTIALFLSEALGTVVTKITHGVLYPLFSRIHREEPEKLKEVYYRARLPMDAGSLLGLGALTILGSRVIDLLYDPRYAEAGWMLEVMCVRVAMSCVLTPCETVLFSMGRTKYAFYQSLARAAWIVIAVPIGYHLGGVSGVVWATVLSEVPVAIVIWPPFVRLGLMKWSRELLALAFFGVGILVGLGLDPLVGQLVKMIRH